LGAKGPVYLSSDYYVISEDQVLAKKNEALLACSKSAKPTSQSARPTTHAASHESAKPSASTASAQIGLADSQSAKPIYLVSAAADASLDDSTLVDRSLEIKNHIIQNKDIHFSDMINKVQNTNILLKFQSGHTILISASIRDILRSSCNRPIDNDNLFINNKINSDSIGQHILPYGKTDNSSLSKLRPLKSNCKDVAEWIDNKSDPFVCLALKRLYKRIGLIN
jgi:hypothetical protein